MAIAEPNLALTCLLQTATMLLIYLQAAAAAAFPCVYVIKMNVPGSTIFLSLSFIHGRNHHAI